MENNACAVQGSPAHGGSGAKQLYDRGNTAELYQLTKACNFKLRSEIPTMISLLGEDLRGKSVLDLACGEGCWSRLIMTQLRADSVVGVDIAARMVQLAQQEEVRHPLGIRYLVGNATQLPAVLAAAGMAGRQFDLVFGLHLLHYALNESELHAMVNAVAACIKPGGRFVGMVCSPFTSRSGYHCRAVGSISTEVLPPAGQAGNSLSSEQLEDCTQILIRITPPGTTETVQFDNTYFQQRTYERAFAQAGLHVQWQQPLLNAQLASRYNPVALGLVPGLRYDPSMLLRGFEGQLQAGGAAAQAAYQQDPEAWVDSQLEPGLREFNSVGLVLTKLK